MSEKVNGKKVESGKIIKEDISLDLKGKCCPIPFIKAKIALEEMKKDEIIKLILDFKPSFTNVPNSIVAQKLGEIIDEETIGKEKYVWVKKI